MPLDKTQLLAKRPSYTDVLCEPLGGKIRIKRLSVQTFLALKDSFPGEESSQEARYLWGCEVIATCAVNEAGELLFADEETRGVLEATPGAVTVLLNAAMQFNGLGSAEEKKSGD